MVALQREREREERDDEGGARGAGGPAIGGAAEEEDGVVAKLDSSRLQWSEHDSGCG